MITESIYDLDGISLIRIGDKLYLGIPYTDFEHEHLSLFDLCGSYSKIICRDDVGCELDDVFNLL